MGWRFGKKIRFMFGLEGETGQWRMSRWEGYEASCPSADYRPQLWASSWSTEEARRGWLEGRGTRVSLRRPRLERGGSRLER